MTKETPANGKRTPRQVLEDKMLFYDEAAAQLLDKIIEVIKAQNPNGQLLAKLYIKRTECDKIAIDCAEKLAPYLHSKLQSLEVKKDSKVTFVVRTPSIARDKDVWMKQVTQEHKAAQRAEQIKNSKIDRDKAITVEST